MRIALPSVVLLVSGCICALGAKDDGLAGSINIDASRITAGPARDGEISVPDPPEAGDGTAKEGSEGTRFTPVTPFAAPSMPFIEPKPASRGSRYGTDGVADGVNWKGLLNASGRFLAIEHGFRFLTEPGTRSGLNGSFLSSWGRAAGNLHGWADGDEFYVNYVGHPMEGSVAGFLWVQNDRAYRSVEFGKDTRYWKSRLRAAAYAWAYSEQFEIGPISEASLGAIQAYHPQQGFVDHVITPSIGMGWMIAEDAVDKYLIKWIEAYTGNRYIRLLVRSGLNPSRTFASVLQGAVPWDRHTRAGVLSYNPHEQRLLASLGVAGIAPTKQSRPEIPDVPGVAPFEFSLTFQPERLSGEGMSLLCLGGAGTAAMRMSPSWQFVTEVGGCKMIGLGKDLSGDSLTYMAGVRKSLIGTRWVAHVQFLAGGNKLTEERFYPEKKKAVEASHPSDDLMPSLHMTYTDHSETNGFAISGGAGVSYKLNRALMLRVAELSCRHSWTSSMWGRDFQDSVKLSSGLVLRMGTW